VSFDSSQEMLVIAVRGFIYNSLSFLIGPTSFASSTREITYDEECITIRAVQVLQLELHFLIHDLGNLFVPFCAALYDRSGDVNKKPHD